MQRLDKLMVAQGLATTRTQAQKLINAGLVKVLEAGEWVPVGKASSQYDEKAQLRAEAHPEMKYVSRAGLKLEAILNLELFCVEGAIALDIGQSTGGFTDCLLQQGAAQVVGVEVGHGQLAEKLRNDPRVSCLEGINARYLNPQLFENITDGFDLVVMDVSFISQKFILPNIPPVIKTGGYLVSLIKPQFEVGPENIGKNGIVNNAEAVNQLEKIFNDLIKKLHFECVYYGPSPIKGGDGNKEYLMVGQLISCVL